MSTEPTSLTNESPQDARRAHGVAADGAPLYRCLRCGRSKRKEQFASNEYGRVNDTCNDCDRQLRLGLPQRRYMKDRSHITVVSKVCKVCGENRPSDEFWLDGKQEDGLKAVCGDCERRRRDYKSARPEPPWESVTPASAIQPALDQAIKERDELAAALESLRTTVGTMQQTAQNQAPRTDLLALNAIETELRWLRERLDESRLAEPPLAKIARKGISRAAALVGPVAYGLFTWADRQVVHEE